MNYNLLFNTDFVDDSKWKYLNCEYKDGYVISNKKIFGIEQEVILSSITKLYLRFNFNILQSMITKVTVGIQNDDKLFINTKSPKSNKDDFISVVEETKLEKIKVHLIFESKEDINKIKIFNPILCDLIRLHKSTLLKFFLDRNIKYRKGLDYRNQLDYSEIKPDIFNLENAKIGSIIFTLDKIELKIDAKLIKGKKYLLKLDYKEINNLGNIFISYGMFRSIKIDDEQLYLIYRQDDINDLIINIVPNDILPYQVNLKHLMILQVEGLGIDKSDIPYLPFI